MCVLTVIPSYIMETVLGTQWKSDYGVGVGPKVTAYSEHSEAKCRNSTKVINGKESLDCVPYFPMAKSKLALANLYGLAHTSNIYGLPWWLR